MSIRSRSVFGMLGPILVVMAFGASPIRAQSAEQDGDGPLVRLQVVLGLRHETTPDPLRFALVELRRVLIEHPKVSHDPARVRFSAFGACSLDLEIFTYILTRDWFEFCAIREDLYLRFMDGVADDPPEGSVAARTAGTRLPGDDGPT